MTPTTTTATKAAASTYQQLRNHLVDAINVAYDEDETRVH